MEVGSAGGRRLPVLGSRCLLGSALLHRGPSDFERIWAFVHQGRNLNFVRIYTRMCDVLERPWVLAIAYGRWQVFLLVLRQVSLLAWLLELADCRLIHVDDGLRDAVTPLLLLVLIFRRRLVMILRRQGVRSVDVFVSDCLRVSFVSA